MGIGSWYANWSAKRRKKKELAALDHLRRELMSEKERLGPIEAIVTSIEVEVNKGNFEKAERMVPDLVIRMKQKNILDKAEKIDFRKFRRTMLKGLKTEMKAFKGSI